MGVNIALFFTVLWGLFSKLAFHNPLAFKRENKSPLPTLDNVILRIARNFLETRENVKILTHPFYHTNLD